jgi:hypothetical protein
MVSISPSALTAGIEIFFCFCLGFIVYMYKSHIIVNGLARSFRYTSASMALFGTSGLPAASMLLLVSPDVSRRRWGQTLPKSCICFPMIHRQI